MPNSFQGRLKNLQTKCCQDYMPVYNDGGYIAGILHKNERIGFIIDGIYSATNFSVDSEDISYCNFLRNDCIVMDFILYF